jgi:hypothetical protein
MALRAKPARLLIGGLHKSFSPVNFNLVIGPCVSSLLNAHHAAKVVCAEKATRKFSSAFPYMYLFLCYKGMNYKSILEMKPTLAAGRYEMPGSVLIPNICLHAWEIRINF